MPHEKSQPKPDFGVRSYLLPKISAEGVPVVAVSFVLSFVLGAMSEFLGVLGLIFSIFSFYFFRDPERYAPDVAGAIIAPADGRLLPVTESALPPELKAGGEKYVKLSIFMSVFDVHVNRNPASGKVLAVKYVEGKFFNADLDKASKDNERSIALVETAGGNRICYAQIAGLVARRIVSRLRAGQSVSAGERFGLIKFGSRLDIYVPKGAYELKVAAGQTMIAGETVLAQPKNTPAR
ncbi:MAG: phosphatidylserine decarboxylase [Rickettsiales bacterium]|nr:phosphatidylserine decarboxylase [Rickettsiales bacterium]